MKICIVCGPFQSLPPAPYGAVEMRWSNLARQFSARDCEVHVIFKRHGKWTPSDSCDTIRYHPVTGYDRTGSLILDFFYDLKYSFQIWGLIARLGKIDVVITNSFFGPFFYRFLVDVRLLCVQVARFPKWQQWVYFNCDQFQAVSFAVKAELLRQSPFLSSKIVLLQNSISSRLFTFHNCESKKRRVGVLYAGRISPEKGLVMLSKAVKKLRCMGFVFEYCIIGPRNVEDGAGGGEYLREVIDACDGDLIIRDPEYDQRKLAEIYASFEIFCYPSLAERGESFGIAPLEAMAAGALTIVSSLECFKDFVEDGVNALIFNHKGPDAVDQLVEKIRYALSLSVRDKKDIRQAARTTAHNFDHRLIAVKHLVSFKNFIERKYGRI